MFTAYVEKAMQHATYKQLDDGTWWGQVTELKFTWAIAPTLEECKQELRDEVEDWLVFAISRHHAIPPLDGVTIAVPPAHIRAASTNAWSAAKRTYQSPTRTRATSVSAASPDYSN